MWRWVFGITAGLIGLYILARLFVGPQDVDHAYALASTAKAIGRATETEVQTSVDGWNQTLTITLTPAFPLPPADFAQNMCQAGSTSYDWTHPWLLQVYVAPEEDAPVAACHLR